MTIKEKLRARTARGVLKPVARDSVEFVTVCRLALFRTVPRTELPLPAN